MKKNLWLLMTIALVLPCATTAYQKADAAPEIPTVTPCDLVSKPKDFDQKEVRIRAVYYVGFEISVFRDPRCEDIWVEFFPPFEERTDKKIYKKFMRLTDARPKHTSNGGIVYADRTAEVVAVGWFDGVEPSQNINGKRYRIGFGHLGHCHYQFTIARIEEVKDPAEKKP